jgi:Tat protein secretion system quality control protein TatD with DNase activity
MRAQVCDERPERGGAELARLLHLISRDRLMLETDAPYLVPRTITPAKQRPRRCMLPASCLKPEHGAVVHACMHGKGRQPN